MFRRVKETVSQIAPLVFSGEHIFPIISGLFLTGANMACELAIPLLLSKTVESLDDGASSIFGEEFSPEGMAALYAAAWTLSGLLGTFRHVVLAPLNHTPSRKLANRYVEQVMTQSLNYHQEEIKSGHDRRFSDMYTIVPTVSTLFTQVVPTVAEVSVAIGFLSSWYGVEIGAGLAAILAAYTGYHVATKGKIITVHDQLDADSLDLYYKVNELIANYKSVHIFDALPRELKELERALIKYEKLSIHADRITFGMKTGHNLISGVGFLTLSMLAAKYYNSPDFIIITSYLSQFATPLAEFGAAVNQLLVASVRLESLWKELNKKSEIQDRYPNNHLDVNPGNASVEFKNIYFGYEGRPPLLKDISFKVAPGQKVAIVGGSGVGKSTILQLLFRFYDPSKMAGVENKSASGNQSEEGAILINGQDIQKVSLASLRKSISIVSQDPILFHDTLLKNITFGSPSATKSEIDQVVDAVGLAQFVASLPQGLDTIVGSGGAKLSGGQKQRIMIARALLKKPSIFFYDEVTTGLDNKNKLEVLKSIKEVSKGITQFFIAHDLASIEDADLILVLQNGRIVQRGTHKELVQDRSGEYFNLWQKENRRHLQREEDYELSIVIDPCEEKERSSAAAASSSSVGEVGRGNRVTALSRSSLFQLTAEVKVGANQAALSVADEDPVIPRRSPCSECSIM